MADEAIRAGAAKQPVPVFDETPWTVPPPLAASRVAVVTTAALHASNDEPLHGGDESFRVIESLADAVFGHGSPNFDRSGWLYDPNVVMPIDRLDELAGDGVIGSVAQRHLSFAGNQQETLTTIRLDSGPAAAKLLREDGVSVVVLTGV